MKSAAPQRSKIIILGIVSLILIGALLMVMDWRHVSQLVGEAAWGMVFFALLCVFISYLFLSYGFVVVNRIFGVRLKSRDLFEIGYISSTLNNLLAFMGAAGHSLRVMIMLRKGVKPEQSLAASIFHSHFHNLMMLCLLPLGIIYLLLHHSVSGSGAVWLVVIAVILIIILVVATAIVFVQSLRRSVLKLINRVIRLIIRKNNDASFKNFDESMTLGVADIRNKPVMLAQVVALIIADWGASVAAMWFCFYALGSPLHLGVLITGYAVGITVGNFSMVPGGLGTQEASMSGVYALLGVPFERAVLAAILFRVVYDFIPFLISMFFYRRLLRTPEKVAGGD